VGEHTWHFHTPKYWRWQKGNDLQTEEEMNKCTTGQRKKVSMSSKNLPVRSLWVFSNLDEFASVEALSLNTSCDKTELHQVHCSRTARNKLSINATAATHPPKYSYQANVMATILQWLAGETLTLGMIAVVVTQGHNHDRPEQSK
jgi:hypothetical protein